MPEIERVPFKHVRKLWGEEHWYVNEKEYCMKRLILRRGFSSSLHYHKVKKETFIIEKGECYLEIHSARKKHEHLMKWGDSIVLLPGQAHRFWIPNDSSHPSCVIIEVSMHHVDEDCERLAESRVL